MIDFRSDTVTRPSPDKEIRVTGGDRPFYGRPGKRLRWVTHLDVSPADIEQALTLAADF